MSNSYLAHHGVKGQKWGVRRFQFLDGVLTALGKLRYNSKNIDFQEIDYNNYNLNDPEQYEEDLKYLRSLIESGFLESIGEDTSEGTFWALIASPTGLSTYIQTLEREYVRSGMKKELARSEARKQTMNIVGFLADKSKELENEKSGRKKKTTHAPHTHNQVYRNSVKKNSEYVVKRSKESGMNWTASHSYPNNTYLAHHGVKGQKHGVRQWQNPDGSLTPAGRIHYGVGAAREKVSSLARSVGKVVKNTAKDLSKQHRESIRASKIRRAKAKAERAERKAERQKEKEEALARKIAARESKKRLSDLKDEFNEARMNDARKKVAALLDKQDRIREKEFLKEQERQLKASTKSIKKQAKRDAKEKYSRKDIRNLSDEELNARVKRLETEIKLASLEAQRAAPKTTAGMKLVGDWVSGGLSTAAKQLIGAKATSLGKNAMGLTDEEINEFIRLTKKK